MASFLPLGGLAWPVRPAADGEGVEAELVPVTANVTGAKACTHQGRSEVAWIVVGLVVVHLVGGARSQAKGRELEEGLAAPGRNVQQERPGRRQDAEKLHQR